MDTQDIDRQAAPHPLWLPAPFYSRILDFLRKDGTGRISLNIKRGSITAIDIEEKLQLERK